MLIIQISIYEYLNGSETVTDTHLLRQQQPQDNISFEYVSKIKFDRAIRYHLICGVLEAVGLVLFPHLPLEIPTVDVDNFDKELKITTLPPSPIAMGRPRKKKYWR